MSAIPELSAEPDAVNMPGEPFCLHTSPRVSVRVPPGMYIIGDPCCAIPEEPWSKFMESASRPDKNTIFGTVLGHYVVAFSTYYGDGVYKDSDGFYYLVDAGMIGLVPKNMPGANVGERIVIECDAPIECWQENGVLHFGDISIDTKYLPGIHDADE